jgi:hypothetical protein
MQLDHPSHRRRWPHDTAAELDRVESGRQPLQGAALRDPSCTTDFLVMAGICALKGPCTSPIRWFVGSFVHPRHGTS